MRVWRNLRRDKLAVTSLIILVSTIVLGIFAPWFAPHDPLKVNMALRYNTPSWEYLLGNDHLGRCILSRLIYGIRPSVLWVIAALAISLIFGGAMGFLAGYFRGKVDALIMRLCDIVLSFPGYVMTLAGDYWSIRRGAYEHPHCVYRDEVGMVCQNDPNGCYAIYGVELYPLLQSRWNE